MRCEYRNNKLTTRRSRFQSVSVTALTLAAGAWMMGAGAASADDASVAKLEKEMHRIEALHQAEIKSLQAQIKHLRAEKGARYAGPVYKGPEAAPALPFVTMTPNHEFGLSSADGQNTINFTGRVHFDVGGYTNYSQYGGKYPTGLASGDNFRRARIGVQGKFMGDWDYALIYDFGGSSDGLNSTGATSYSNTKYTSGSLSGGGVSGIENAFITYKGFYNHHQPFPVAITIGAIDVPWTLGEAMSSNDLPMMERPTPQVFATTFGGGDNRTALGATSNDKHYFLGAWVTGPTTGALHEIGGSGLGGQFAFLGRAAYTLTPTPDSTLHAGFNYAYTFDPRQGNNLEGFSLSDRAEVRIDPTSFLSTGAIPAKSGQVFGAEAAATWQNAFIQGEYFHYVIDTLAGTTAVAATSTTGAYYYGGYAGPQYSFDGGYVQASYTFGGKRHYNPASGGYSGVVPDHPLAFGSDGWGALELVGTFSTTDTNSNALNTLASAGGGYTKYSGGKETAYGGGVTWYPNLNMRFMLDYEHYVVNNGVGVGTSTASGATIDWVGARTQIMW
jgi:phosphate-selective porin OprO and OprP